MNSIEFASINTEISLRERTFFSQEQLEQLLQAKSNEEVALLLQGTPYELSAVALDDHQQIEQVLMRALAQEYQFAYEQAPNQQIVDGLALKYVYHNLKVLLKMRAVEQDFSDLLIPIGAYSMEQLRQLALTLDSEAADALLVEEVQQTWSEYSDYQTTVAIDVGMDSAYFRQLRQIADQTDEPVFAQFIIGLIDFFNAITVKRALDQNQPNSFMYQLLSRKGSVSARDMIEYGRQGQWESWFHRVNQLPYAKAFDPYIAKMQSGDLTAFDLEKMRDVYLMLLLQPAQYEAIGVLAVVRYLYGKEMEVLNLRLILTGRANRLVPERLVERMRPSYYGNDSL